MKCYAIGEINFSDHHWVNDYLKNVTPLVEKLGGIYLARTPSVEVLEGEGGAPQTVVLIQFPSKEVAMKFYHSDEYESYKKARKDGSHGRFMLVDGHDVALDQI